MWEPTEEVGPTAWTAYREKMPAFSTSTGGIHTSLG